MGTGNNIALTDLINLSFYNFIIIFIYYLYIVDKLLKKSLGLKETTRKEAEAACRKLHLSMHWNFMSDSEVLTLGLRLFAFDLHLEVSHIQGK